MKWRLITVFACACALVIACNKVFSVEAQLLDRLFQNRNQDEANNVDPASGQQPMSAIVRKMMNALSVNVPLFYDMTKNGSSMGINVLSGLVRVERGREAERSGLIGPRPLSVRVFGVPVYERGVRVANPPNDSDVPNVVETGLEKPARPDVEEELPIET